MTTLARRPRLLPLLAVAFLSTIGTGQTPPAPAPPPGADDAEVDRGAASDAAPAGETWVLSDFETEGEFLDWFPTGTVAIDRSVRLHGEASLRLESEGDGSPVAAEAALARPLDLRGSDLVLHVRVDEPGELAELWLQVTSDGWDSFVTFPLEERAARAEHGWVAVAARPQPHRTQGTPDLARVDRLRLRANDRGRGPVVVHVDRLEVRPRPASGVVTITFDDGWANQAGVAWPIMRERGLPGTVFVIPYLVGVEGRLSEEDLRALRDDGWDVGGHYHPSLEGREEPELSGIVRTVAAFTERWAEGAPLAFAYPQGYFAGEVLPAVAARFDGARTVLPGFEALPPADPWRLRSLEVQSDTPLEAIEAALARAAEERLWFVLSFHRVTPDVDAATELAPDRFEAMMDLVAASGLPVRTMTEVLDDPGPGAP